MQKLGKLTYVLLLLVTPTYITTMGFDRIIVFFKGESIGLWNTYFLTMAICMLLFKHSQKHESILEKSGTEILAIAIWATIFDAISVFLILPRVLS